MKHLISESTKAALIEQLAAEKFNANLYLRIAAFLDSKGLKSLSKHFLEQHDEETQHSLMIYHLLSDLGEDFGIPEINAVENNFETIMDIAKLYLQREEETTTSLKEIRQLAATEGEGGCPIVEVAMIDMLRLQ